MRWEVFFRVAVAIGLIAGSIFLAIAVIDVYPREVMMAGDLALRRLQESGVEHSVTAVLLNFRAYDTMMEIVVLVVAFWGAWSLRVPYERPLSRPPDLLLTRVASLLIPILILLAVYLLWSGSHQPGGEFQAAAVLGAAGVLLLLIGRSIPGANHQSTKEMLVIVGVTVFLAVAFLGLFTKGYFLSYPPGWEKTLMYAIEIGAIISIAFILVALFAGSDERLRGDVESGGGDS